MQLFVFVCSIAFASLTVTPKQMNVHPNQCVEIKVSFPESNHDNARRIVLSSNNPKVGVFVSRDCSGGVESTISSLKPDFYFTVQPAADISPGTYSVVVNSTLNGDSQLGDFSLLVK